MRTRRSSFFIRIGAAAVLTFALAMPAAWMAIPQTVQAATQTGWYAQDPGFSGLDFQDISVLDANTVWAAAKGGYVFKSTDGGNTWVRRTGLPGG